jgi:hypothetical protein
MDASDKKEGNEILLVLFPCSDKAMEGFSQRIQ